MHSVNHILVGLDLSKTDKQVLAYTKELAALLSPKRITFVNVHATVTIPKEIAEQFPDVKSDIDDRYIGEMVRETNNFNVFGVEQVFRAMEGNPLPKLIELVENEAVDLLIVGKRVDGSRSAVSHRKLVRKAPCDVVVVPGEINSVLNRILVPVDFSANSKDAVERALFLAKLSGGEVICHHVYEVPIGYSKTGKSFTEFAEIMRGHAENSMSEFLKDIPTDGMLIETSYSLTGDNDVVHDILSAARSNDSDMIVVGAKGRTNLAAVFMGSIAEGLAEHDRELPVFVVHPVNERFGFIDVIKSA